MHATAINMPLTSLGNIVHHRKSRPNPSIANKTANASQTIQKLVPECVLRTVKA